MFETFVLPNQLCGGGEIEKVWGTLFNVIYFTEFFPTPFSFSLETAVTAGEE